jgi:hypothetical protein
MDPHLIVNTAVDTIAGGIADDIRADYLACYEGDRFVESLTTASNYRVSKLCRRSHIDHVIRKRQENYLLSFGEMRSRSGEAFQLCLARSLSSHLRGVKRDPPHPYHQGC